MATAPSVDKIFDGKVEAAAHGGQNPLLIHLTSHPRNPDLLAFCKLRDLLMHRILRPDIGSSQ